MKFGSPSARLATRILPTLRSFAFLDWTGRKTVGRILFFARNASTQLDRTSLFAGGPIYPSDPSGVSAGSCARKFGIGKSNPLIRMFDLSTATKAMIVASIVKKHSLCTNMAAPLSGNHTFVANHQPQFRHVSLLWCGKCWSPAFEQCSSVRARKCRQQIRGKWRRGFLYAYLRSPVPRSDLPRGSEWRHS